MSNSPLTRRLASGPIKRSTHDIVGAEGFAISIVGEAVEIEPTLVIRGKKLFIRLHTDDRMIEAAMLLDNRSCLSAFFPLKLDLLCQSTGSSCTNATPKLATDHWYENVSTPGIAVRPFSGLWSDGLIQASMGSKLKFVDQQMGKVQCACHVDKNYCHY